MQQSQFEDEKEVLEKSVSQLKEEKRRLEAAFEAFKKETEKEKIQKENSLEDLKV